jgi:hypothetical protein
MPRYRGHLWQQEQRLPILTPVRGDLRRFLALDGLEYRIELYQTAQFFLLFALSARQSLQQPVVLLLADFVLFHCLRLSSGDPPRGVCFRVAAGSADHGSNASRQYVRVAGGIRPARPKRQNTRESGCLVFGLNRAILTRHCFMVFVLVKPQWKFWWLPGRKIREASLAFCLV